VLAKEKVMPAKFSHMLAKEKGMPAKLKHRFAKFKHGFAKNRVKLVKVQLCACKVLILCTQKLTALTEVYE